MAPGGVEPPLAASKAAALSAELRGHDGWTVEGGGRDSNPRPPGPQPGALPTELPPPRAVIVSAAPSGAFTNGELSARERLQRGEQLLVAALLVARRGRLLLPCFSSPR